MNKKVTYVKFHQGLFVPGLGDIGSTLPSPSKTFRLDLSSSSEGLQIKAKTEVNAQTYDILVPWANVVLAVFAKE